jgi:nicotinate-nucleotide--dimethylbenzimidazole phosphoribosyltransferase
VTAGLVLGASQSGKAIVIDGLATSVAALCAVRLEPGAAAHLVAGQRSRERAHGVVLEELGLEPLLDLRMRAGEGVGAVLSTLLLTNGLQMRATAGRVAPAADDHPIGPGAN